MRVYNTLSHQKEELVVSKPPKITVYVCGPTTYNYIHLGNARPLVVFDTVRRYLEYRGYDVAYVQNFTDVDDKIINRAQELGEDPLKLSAHFIEEFFKDADALGIRRADFHPRVSQHVPEIVKAIERLIDKGYAYQVEGDVFFRVKAFKDYGKLSGRTLEEMQVGARVEVDERKKDPVDFALWKAAKEGEPFWESPWGKGRPGWHIECSVMASHYLGETIDIHGGGSDLVFPHHENEIAQSEALTGKPFVNYWMHNGFITINNEKMSKSRGNFFILRDILNQFPADVVRFYLIAIHYRSPLDFDDGKLEEARKALNRLKTTLMLLEEFIVPEFTEDQQVQGKPLEFLNQLETLENHFIEAMDDDFNTAKAIGYLFEISHLINSYLAEADRQNPADQYAVGKASHIFKDLGNILGLFISNQPAGQEKGEKAAEIFLQLRQQARQQKDYQLADTIRDFLGEHKISVEDTDTKSRLKFQEEVQLDILVEKLLNLRAAFKANRNYQQADFIRSSLQEQGIVIEDTREGARWKIVDA